MFLRKKRKVAGGESYDYWSLCETIRTAKGPRQRVVAGLGKLDEEQIRSGSWQDIESLLAGKPASRDQQLSFDKSQASEAPAPLWEKVDVAGVSVERVREFGEVYLPLALWHRLGLGELLGELIEPGRESVDWPTVASILVAARFCAQSSELGVAEGWYEKTALEDLLGVEKERINDDRLYRGLDVLGQHKEKLCAHLIERYRDWFGVRMEFLLYDVTSTFFEGQAEKNPKAARGYSRDSRSEAKTDCRQAARRAGEARQPQRLQTSLHRAGLHTRRVAAFLRSLLRQPGRRDHGRRDRQNDGGKIRSRRASLGDGPRHGE